MNRIEHYHDWLRDAHAMEKQAESMLESMVSRIDNYPELRARIEQHLSETKNQIVHALQVMRGSVPPKPSGTDWSQYLLMTYSAHLSTSAAPRRFPMP